jgi:magnesium chelatase family protein
VSGPLIDRIDIQIEMSRVPPNQLLRGPAPESSATVRERICAARSVALARNGGRPNALLPATAVLEACRLEKSATNVLVELAAMDHLSARSVHRLMRVGRSIADLLGHGSVTADDVLAAYGLRDPGAAFDDRVAA